MDKKLDTEIKRQLELWKRVRSECDQAFGNDYDLRIVLNIFRQVNEGLRKK